MEMLHVMLKYTEVVNNVDFIKVSTMPLELWSGITVSYNIEMEDGAYTVSVV